MNENDQPSQILRLNYWTAFRNYLQDNKSRLRPQKPSKDHWYDFGIGTSQAHVSALLISRDNKIGVNLYLKKDAKEIFANLIQHRVEFERIIGSSLDWREMPDKKVSRIVLFKNVKDFDEKNWPEQFAWLQQTLEKFDDAFRPYFEQRKAAA